MNIVSVAVSLTTVCPCRLNNSYPASSLNTHMLSCPMLARTEDELLSPPALAVDSSPKKCAQNRQKRFSFGGFFGHKPEAAQEGADDSVAAFESSRIRSHSVTADLKRKKGKVPSTGDLSGGAVQDSLTHLAVPSLLSPMAPAQSPKRMEAKDRRKMSLPASASSSLVTGFDRSTSLDPSANSHNGFHGVPRHCSGGATAAISHEDLSNTSTDLVDIRELVKGLDLQQLARSHTQDTNEQQQEAGAERHSNANSPGGGRRGSFDFEITPSPTSLSPVQANSGLGSPHELTNGQLQSPSESPTFVEGLDPITQLTREPWYHGLLLRSDCSRLLQSLGHNATGRYLVRKSESVNGEYVLSFNFQGRAKVRLSY